jgi:DNA-binding SARP family transcriptional activator/class 3 adenylate cyclase/tetratricopeptide (TPR) repeat protein
MDFRILGPLEVLENGRPVELGGAKLRALLAILLLHANEVVSTDRLIDALWEEDAPETGRKALQVYVSQLRKALGKERIATQSLGYRLQVGPEELDLLRFQRLLDEGKASEALSIWRGPPLSDFAYERFAHNEIARLEDLYLACLEERVEADLTAGRHSALVGELEVLVREHPLRERMRGQLMLALYRSGRQAEALEVYQDTRAALVDELGIEPSRELRELQQAILRQDPALELTTELEQSKPLPAAATRLPASSEPDPSTRSGRKTVTVVHVRTGVAEGEGGRLDPEVLRGVTSGVFTEITQAIEAHEGTIEAMTGDSVSGVFGLPIVHEDDAVRALRAAEEIRGRLTRLERTGAPAPQLDVRIGVSTGVVVTGGRSGEPRRTTGEPLTISSRLAQEADPGEIAVDDPTRRAAHAARRDAKFASPMVGRERERRRLQGAFEQAVGDRSCQLFSILGAAGVGKSRLVQEFLGGLDTAAVVAHGRCLPYGEGITFWPVVEAVRDAADLDDSDSAEESMSKLDALLEGEEDADLAARRLGVILGLSDELSGAEESFWAVRTFFEALARRRPLVVVFDDIHWAEPTFLDLVDHVSDWTRDVPVLLLCVARPELLDARPQWGGGKLNATSVLLEPLSELESAELVDNLVGSLHLDEPARKHIAETAGGNPLFVEELLALVLDLGRTPAGFEVPPTIQALLAARLDRLTNGERAAIEAASIEGQVFHEGSVGELIFRSPAEVHRDLLTLVRKELIRPARALFSGEHGFRFRHLLIRDAAYQAIPKEARAGLHERYAGWLEEKAGERALEFEEIVGYHLEQAFRYRLELHVVDDAGQALGTRAGQRLAAAGRRALARGDTPAAINLCSRAASLLPRDDPLRVHVVPSVRIVQGLGDQLQWAEAVASDAIEGGDRRMQAHGRVQQALLRLFVEPTVDVDELRRTATEAIDAFEELQDELGLARAWRLLQQAHYLGRQGAKSSDAAERALLHARRAEDMLEEVEIMTWLGVGLYMGSIPAPEAERRVKRHLDEQRASRTVEALLLGCLAPLEAMQGRISEARALLERARSVVDDLAYLSQLAVVPFHAGVTEQLAENPVAAERVLRAALEPLEEVGETSTYSSIVAVLARAVSDQGRYEEAEELTHVSERAARINDIHAQATWRPVRARSLAQRGLLEQAERLAEEAIAFAAESDFLNAHGDALLDFAEILDLAGRPAEARSAVETAVGLYERKGNVVSAARAKRILAAPRRKGRTTRRRA